MKRKYERKYSIEDEDGSLARSRKTVKELSDLPASASSLKTARLAGINGAAHKRDLHLTLDDLTSPPLDKHDAKRCDEVVEDIKEYLYNKTRVQIYDASDEDLSRKLRFVRIPAPRRLLEGLQDLNMIDLSCIMERLPKPVVTAITLYRTNPENYIKNIETNIAYRKQAYNVLREYAKKMQKQKK